MNGYQIMPDNLQDNDQIKPVDTVDKPTYSEDGVDLTLIRWMLSLTPAERLQVLQQNVESILILRNARSDT
jgi:hypothetical protein